MNVIKKAIGFLKESKEELQKVTWPSRKEIFRYTLFVIVTVIISVGVVFIFDVFLIKLVQFFVVR